MVVSTATKGSTQRNIPELGEHVVSERNSRQVTRMCKRVLLAFISDGGSDGGG